MRQFTFTSSFEHLTHAGSAQVTGVIAQEIEQILPNAVHTIPYYDFPDFRVMNYDQLFLNAMGATKKLISDNNATRSTLNGVQTQLNLSILLVTSNNSFITSNLLTDIAQESTIQAQGSALQAQGSQIQAQGSTIQAQESTIQGLQIQLQTLNTFLQSTFSVALF